VANYVKEAAIWAAEAGIPADKWFSHQLPGDYLFGANPDTKNKNARYYSSASPLWTADIRPYGLIGATVYDVKFPDFTLRTSAHALSALAAMANNWAILEYDAETYPVGYQVEESSMQDILSNYLEVYSHNPRIINFWRWMDASGEHRIKGKNKEKALRRFLERIRDKGRNINLSHVFDPPKIIDFSGEHKNSSNTNVLSIGRKIWEKEKWEWLDWGDFAFFEIFRGEEPGFTADTAHKLGQTKQYSYIDDSISSGATYYYRVRAVNTKGVGGGFSWTIRLPKGNSHILTLTAEEGGTTEPSPGLYDFANGVRVEVLAVPDSYYQFSNWSGDASGNANPASLLIDRDKAVTANFGQVQIYAPVNFQGESVIYRAWILKEHAHRMTWEPDPRNTDITLYRIYELENEVLSLTVEVDSDVFEYLCRGVDNTRDYNYQIVAVDSLGNESSMASVLISAFSLDFIST